MRPPNLWADWLRLESSIHHVFNIPASMGTAGVYTSYVKVEKTECWYEKRTFNRFGRKSGASAISLCANLASKERHIRFLSSLGHLVGRINETLNHFLSIAGPVQSHGTSS
jgi:hypothetical protein